MKGMGVNPNRTHLFFSFYRYEPDMNRCCSTKNTHMVLLQKKFILHKRLREHKKRYKLLQKNAEQKKTSRHTVLQKKLLTTKKQQKNANPRKRHIQDFL